MESERTYIVEVIKAITLEYHNVAVPIDLIDNCLSERNLMPNHDVYVSMYNRRLTPCFNKAKWYIEQKLGFTIEPYIKKLSGSEINYEN